MFEEAAGLRLRRGSKYLAGRGDMRPHRKGGETGEQGSESNRNL